MLKTIVLVFSILAGSIITAHVVLQNGSLLRYLDQHPDPRWVPPVEFFVGQAYFIKQNLTTAATYFIRIADRYPASSFAERAYYDYLECLSKDVRTTRPELIQVCETYLERFPNGEHSEIIRVRLGSYKSGL